MKRTIAIALAGFLMLGAGYQADAQVNLNALKNAAKQKAASAIQNAGRNTGNQNNNAASVHQTTTSQPTETVSQPVYNNNASPAPQKEQINLFPVHNVPCPWPMEKDDYDQNHGPVVEFVRKMGEMTYKGDMQALKDALVARAKEDSMEIARLKPHRLQMEMKHDMAFDTLERELKRLDYFYSMLGDYTTRLNFNGTVEMATGQATVQRIGVRLEKTTAWVMWDKNDKAIFYDMSGQPMFLEDEDMVYVDNALRQYIWVDLFLKGLEDKEYQKVDYIANLCFNCINEAKTNNSVDNIEFLPYPKGGALNSLAPKCLASAKKSESYADALAVVIEESSWTVDYDAFGQPIRRKVGGWVIKNTKYGKKAYRAQFSEDHMGGGKYGEVKLYGIGGGSHYVK